MFFDGDSVDFFQVFFVGAAPEMLCYLVLVAHESGFEVPSRFWEVKVLVTRVKILEICCGELFSDHLTCHGRVFTQCNPSYACPVDAA